MSTGCDPCSLAAMLRVKPRELGELTGETSTIMHRHSKTASWQTKTELDRTFISDETQCIYIKPKQSGGFRKTVTQSFFLLILNRNQSQCSAQMHRIHRAAMYSGQVESRVFPIKHLNHRSCARLGLYIIICMYKSAGQPQGTFHIFMRYIL